MENLRKHRSHVALFRLLIVLLHFTSLHFLSLAYELPDKYFINCGSSTNETLHNQVFTPDGSFCSKQITTVKGTSQLPGLYQTARVFSQESYYEFNIPESGTYFVRLHFLAFSSSSRNLSDALFDVSAFPNVPNSGFKLLSNFTAKNNINSPLIIEFFVDIVLGSFKIYFTPQGQPSFAFVNAIEVFLAPADFSPENYPHSFPLVLRTTYRVNVGGQIITPDSDNLRRTWDSDDVYLSSRNSAENTGPSPKIPDYTQAKSDGFVPTSNGFVTSANGFIAPDLVYQTAKVMSNGTDSVLNPFNITWSFNVSRNASYLVRAHFWDLVGDSNSVRFSLYSNGNFVKEVGGPGSVPVILKLPYYYDFVVNSNDLESINITIGPSRLTDSTNSFLNGLEMFEIMGGSALSDPPASICGMKESNKRNLGLVVGSVLGGVLLICILVVGVLFRLKCKKAKHVENSEWTQMPGLGGSAHSRMTDRTISGSPLTYLNFSLKISFAELQRATNNFHSKLMIGEGGFGYVYKGTLSSGRKVAVKRGKREAQGSGQGLLEFEREIMVLSKIRHVHLVSLIGYCDEKSEMILVYEFMEKGSLRDHLYDSNLPRLPWKQRLDICIGAARGLHYLHKGAAGGIIHRDVKSTNILLDENQVAKVADFGLSRSGPLDESHVSTNVRGTFGYLDPEYIMSQQLTEKSDVYSFGVVLLEVLCARPAIDATLPREQMNLAEWGMACKKKGLIDQIVDSAIKGQIDPSSLKKFSDIAEKCLQEDSYGRPTMGDVLWDLEYALQLQQTVKHREPHEDSTVGASSAAFVLQDAQRFPSFSSTINVDSMALQGEEDESDTAGNQVFSQLNIGQEDR